MNHGFSFWQMQDKTACNRIVMGLTLLSIQCSFLLQLQVPDEALSLVMSMGYTQRDAKRALRMNNQDVGGAIDFLVEEKAKKMQKDEEDLKRRDEIRWVQLDVY